MNQSMLFPSAFDSGAIISEDGRYRYRLWRGWDDGPRCNFLMLNPSTADATYDDPTIRRCIGYARRWGYGGLVVTNLFAIRSTDPRALREADDPIGADNDRHIIEMAKESELVLCAWGIHGVYRNRSKDVRNLLIGAGADPKLLTLSASGEPGHPLYLRGDLTPVAWD